MKFAQVSVLSIAHVDAPHRITSAAIEDQLTETMERVGVRPGLLEQLSGIVARRWWDEGVQPSQVAALAAERAIEQAGIDRSRIGLIVSTSVCRDYIEPSVASLVHGTLGLSTHCLNFDIGNACLAFITGMNLAAAMLERGDIDYGLVVDGEGSRFVASKTIERLRDPACDQQTFRDNFATLTLGSGAAAMVLGRTDTHPEGHRYLGGVSLAASEHNRLCLGQVDHMRTDTRKLLFAGLELAQKTWEKARAELGWQVEALDELVLHQVSKVHTEQLCGLLGLPMHKALTLYPEFGNVGPASVPMALSKAVEAGRVAAGARVALMGIGSGLNVAMSEIVW